MSRVIALLLLLARRSPRSPRAPRADEAVRRRRGPRRSPPTAGGARGRGPTPAAGTSCSCARPAATCAMRRCRRRRRRGTSPSARRRRRGHRRVPALPRERLRRRPPRRRLRAHRDVRAVSSPSFDEATPAIWRSTVVFTRRVRGCDVPYVKDLRSSAPSRRLLHAQVPADAGRAGEHPRDAHPVSSVDLSGADEHGAGRKTSEIRRYSARGGGSSVLLRQTFGEASNLFGQVAQDDRFAWTVRTGIHQANAFVRIPSGRATRQEVRAFRTPRHRLRAYAGRRVALRWSCRTTAPCAPGSSPRRPTRSARPSTRSRPS